jgi:sugar/nucleoside kinase (ribokinase family)
VQFDVNPSTNDGPTGTSLILTTPDTERTMCTNLGVSTELSQDDVEVDQLAKSKFAYIEGYLWSGDQTRAASTHVMEHAKSKGIPVAFTYSDMFLVELFGDDFKRITKEFCDVIFCNADEIRHFFGSESLDDCKAELGKIVDTAFVTDGPNGCHLIHKGQNQLVEGFTARAVDTVGAGDAFAGGALYGLTNGLDYADAARWGNYVASRVVQVYGARLEEAVADQVDKVLGR